MSLEGTETWSLPSSYSEQEYVVHVALPRGYQGSEETYPVMVLLDSDLLFGLVRDVVGLLALEEIFLGEVRVPELIVVGVGYPGGLEEMSAERGRDLVAPSGGAPEGGSSFFRFVTEDLIPAVEERYRARGEGRTLLGASRAGVFILGTLFRQPGFFERYVALSPVVEPPIMAYAESWAAEGSAPAARLYLSAGDAGEVESQLAAGIERLARRLEEHGAPGLGLSYETFPGESHVSVLPRALVEGLVAVFAAPES